MSDDGGPAFPTGIAVDDKHVYTSGHVKSGSNGMSLRDWFAGQALVGLLASSPTSNDDDLAADANATWAYELADAMIAERDRR